MFFKLSKEENLTLFVIVVFCGIKLLCRFALNDRVVCHCEEQNDEAISYFFIRAYFNYLMLSNLSSRSHRIFPWCNLKLLIC